MIRRNSKTVLSAIMWTLVLLAALSIVAVGIGYVIFIIVGSSVEI